MIIIIKDQTYSVEFPGHLIKLIQQFPEEHDTIALQLIENYQALISIAPYTDGLIEILKELSFSESEQIIDKILSDLNHYKNFIIPYQLTSWFEKSEVYGSLIFYKILSNSYRVKTIFTNYVLLAHVVCRLPEKYAQALLEHLFSSYSDYNYLITTPTQLIHLIKELPEKFETYKIKFLEQFLRDYFPLGEYHLFDLAKKLPTQYGKLLTKFVAKFYKRTLLFYAIQFSQKHTLPSFICLLLELGDKPTGLFEGKDALQLLLEKNNYEIDPTIVSCAMILIQHGCDVNNISPHPSVLNLLIKNRYYKEAEALILNYGAETHRVDQSNQNTLDILLQTPNFSKKASTLAILILQQGTFSSHITHSQEGQFNNKNILEILYVQYPNIQNYLLDLGIPRNALTDPLTVFYKIDRANFCLEIKYQSEAHRAKSNFFNLCLMLAFDHKQESYFHALPLELLFHIFSFMHLGKTNEECLGLLQACQEQRNLIKQIKGPGGVIALQKNNPERLPTFTFFSSATTACVDYQKLKRKLKKEQVHQNPIWDMITHKQFTQTSLQTLSNFQREALSLRKNHLSYLKKNPPEKKKVKRITHLSELYGSRTKKKT